MKRKKPVIDDPRFFEWLNINPHVLPLFLRFAREMRDAGRLHYGINALTERVRWHCLIETRGDSFKINNNWAPAMARLLVRYDPSLDGLFEFRRAKCDG